MDERGQKLFISADVGIELIVRLLDGPSLGEACLGERAGEEGDGGIDGEDAFGVTSRDRRRWTNSETMGNRPVLDRLRQIFLLGRTEGWGEGAPGGERRWH